ncbi:hydroxyacid dehydrogenase [Arthrobacter sp. B1805]|uniref:hydroxyacid dehydrogenase n=1 Tax=Arthrobacter sp. B1805 TaxID=2058892 RepID=UPI000CE5172B|nr:hydroxyacid dehydrogenase [Arthrobacter sp. B1805]
MTIRAAYVLGQEGYDRIYGPEQRAAITELCGTEPPFVPADVASAPGTVLAGTVLADTEVILSGWGAPVMDEEFLARVPRLRAVLYAAGAVRGFVTPALARNGVLVSSAASANAIPVAEYTLATILFSLKGGWAALRSPRSHAIADVDDVPGSYHSTVGLLALGTIGRLVSERLKTTDTRVLAYDPYASPAEAAELGVRLVDLQELFTADVVSIHAPLLEETRNLVDRSLLASMKTRATIINTARGAVIDHDALADVLAARPDLQAVLDVTHPEPLPESSPLLTLPNVVVTPHIAGSLGPECHRMADLMTDELRRLATGEPLRHAVDLGRLDRVATP